MRQLLVRDGDLVVSGDIRTISGAARVRMDLSHLIRTEIGSNRFAESYGSTIPRFIGAVLDEDTAREIEDEVRRAIANYASAQAVLSSDAALRGDPPPFSSGEQLTGVASVTAVVTFSTIRVSAQIETLDEPLALTTVL